MSKWKRRFVWMAAVGLAGIVYLCFFGPQTYFALLTRYTGRKVPIVNSIPVSLEDLSVSEVRGNRLSFQGAEFEVPWDDLDERNTRITGKWALFHFLSGRSIVLCVGSPSMFIDGLAKDKTIDPKLFAVLFGENVLQSDYTLYNAIYKTSPSQTTLSTTANRAAGLTGQTRQFTKCRQRTLRVFSWAILLAVRRECVSNYLRTTQNLRLTSLKTEAGLFRL